MCFMLGIQSVAKTAFVRLWGCGTCSGKDVSLNHQTKWNYYGIQGKQILNKTAALKLREDGERGD